MSNRLVRLRPVSASTATTEITGSDQQLQLPITGLVDGAGVAVDRSEYVFIADYDKHVIFRYRKGASASTIWAGSYGVSGLADGQGSAARFTNPTHLAVDRSGVLYVVDSGNNRVRRIDQNANVYTVAAIPAVGADQIGGIAVDDSGTIYLVDNS
jgi:DNA-binding beta-propeller fold protein YncE